MNLETRAHRAAEAADERATTTDTQELYARIVTAGERTSPAAWAAGVAVTAVAATAVVIAVNADRGVVVETPDPLATPDGASASPSGETATDAPVSGDCSAAGLPGALEATSSDVPAAAAQTRALLAELAVACDFDQLAEIAQADETMISFGHPEESATGSAAVDYWQRVEGSGEPAMRILRVLLETDPLVQTFESADTTITTWPALAALDPNVPGHAARMDAAIDDLVATGLYTREEIDETLRGGTGWLGWRVGITADGTWSYFVAGD